LLSYGDFVVTADQETSPLERRMSMADVVDLCQAFENAGVVIWIDGGWGVDALLGRQSREHGDLDIAIESKDHDSLRSLLLAASYVDKGGEGATPWNYVMRDAEGHEVDLHVVVLDEAGNGVLGPAELNAVYPAHAFTGQGHIGGHSVRCIAPEEVVLFHSGYELRPSDCQDVKAVCAAFDLPVPADIEQAARRFGQYP